MNRIVQGEVEHVVELAKRVRQADVSELEAAAEMGALDALLISFSLSTEAYTWMCGEDVVAVFGVAPDPDHAGVGCPWMIGSDLVRREKQYLFDTAPKFIERFSNRYPLLANFVHPDNTASIRWLERCGFQFGEPEPYGAKGALFLPFFKEQ